jgi:hypothetical protein
MQSAETNRDEEIRQVAYNFGKRKGRQENKDKPAIAPSL